MNTEVLSLYSWGSALYSITCWINLVQILTLYFIEDSNTPSSSKLYPQNWYPPFIVHDKNIRRNFYFPNRITFPPSHFRLFGHPNVLHKILLYVTSSFLQQTANLYTLWPLTINKQRFFHRKSHSSVNPATANSSFSHMTHCCCSYKPSCVEIERSGSRKCYILTFSSRKIKFGGWRERA